MAMVPFWLLFSFLCGALPLSFWIGRLALGVDIRDYGDGNPGAANVWRAGGPFWGWLAILADFSKGAIPVALVNFVLGWDGWSLAAAAVAPVIGHAFSPFLGFRGGKALAVTFGVWTGLTIWIGPVTLGLALAVWLFVLKKEAYAVLAGCLSQMIIFLLLGSDWVWLVVSLAISILLIYKFRFELVQRRPT